MAKRSIVSIRRSEIKQRGKAASRHFFNGQKKQRRLFEFDIPTTHSLPIRKRSGHTLVVNDENEPIILEEETLLEKSEDVTEVGFEIIDSEEDGENEQHSSDNSHVIIQNAIQEVEVEESGEEVVQMMKEVQKREEQIFDLGRNSSKLKKSEEIRCPICNADLSNFELYEKEAHCESCIEKVNKVEDEKPLRKPSTTTESKSKVKKASNKREKPISAKRRTPKPSLPSIKILTFANAHQIVVDGFNYAPKDEITQYFLSHFHSDHYMGLCKSWDQGQIFCSNITKLLLQHKFKISDERITVLENGELFPITDNITVIALDANHCPGAQIYLFQETFKGKIVKQILHTGDFRANRAMVNEIETFLPHDNKIIDQIYLDTTYLSPGNSHPSQELVIERTCSFLRRYWEKIARDKNNILGILSNQRKKKLVLVGSYAIGKEKLALSISDSMKNNGVYIHDVSLRQYFMSDCIVGVEESNVHIVPLKILKDESSICEYLKNVCHLQWLTVDLVGIIPTGWTFSPGSRSYEAKRMGLQEKMDCCQNLIDTELDESWFLRQVENHKKKKKGKFQIFKIPYSEHSSFNELVKFDTNNKFSWDEIVPTVNLERLNDMNEWFSVWHKLSQDNTKVRK